MISKEIWKREKKLKWRKNRILEKKRFYKLKNLKKREIMKGRSELLYLRDLREAQKERTNVGINYFPKKPKEKKRREQMIQNWFLDFQSPWKTDDPLFIDEILDSYRISIQWTWKIWRKKNCLEDLSKNIRIQFFLFCLDIIVNFFVMWHKMRFMQRNIYYQHVIFLLVYVHRYGLRPGH